jgi:hypothetical protein
MPYRVVWIDKRTKIILLIVFLLPLLFVGVILLSGYLDKKRVADLPVIPVTFETISNHEEDKVSIDGRISLGLAVSCDHECDCNDNHSCCVLDFAPLDQTIGNDDIDVDLYLQMTTLDAKKPNNFYLPYYFEPDEFRIYTNDGQVLTIDDAIRVIGLVEGVGTHQESTYVYICVLEIEAGE